MSTSSLFQPIQVGAVNLQHRVVLAPMTRNRASKFEHVSILPLVKLYYSQRSSAPGTLVITEGTFIAAKAGGYTNVPGIWSDVQINAWKEITDAVHANGSYIFSQLWALGRTAEGQSLKAEDPSFDVVAPSAVPLAGHNSGAPPHALSLPEIREYLQLYAQAAKNAIERAGFDGVEIHGANGYLIEQFLQPHTNTRTDEYGGSVENRSRFGLEVVKAIVDVVGEDRTAIRLTPWGKAEEMGMEDPIPQYSHFITNLKEKFPSLAYIHVAEPRVMGAVSRTQDDIRAHESNDFIRDIWAPRPFISAGGFTRESAIQRADDKGDLIAFGRPFIANPDLPFRLRTSLPLNKYNRKTFYTPGEDENAAEGYIDYPLATLLATTTDQSSPQSRL